MNDNAGNTAEKRRRPRLSYIYRDADSFAGHRPDRAGLIPKAVDWPFAVSLIIGGVLIADQKTDLMKTLMEIIKIWRGKNDG